MTTPLTESKKPVKIPLQLNQLCSAGLLFVIELGAGLLLVISCAEIVWQYGLILMGNTLTESQKTIFEYSIPVFVGSALYRMTYSGKVKKLVKKILGVDLEVKPLQKEGS